MFKNKEFIFLCHFISFRIMCDMKLKKIFNHTTRVQEHLEVHEQFSHTYLTRCHHENDTARSNLSRSESDERQASDALSALAEVKQRTNIETIWSNVTRRMTQVIRTPDLIRVTEATVRLCIPTNHREKPSYLRGSA